MPKVYIPNEPLIYSDRDGRGFEDGGGRRCVDLKPARDHGDLIFLTPPGRLSEDPATFLPLLTGKMRDVGRDDAVVFVGDPRAYAYACVYMASKLNGFLRVLLWNNNARRYEACATNVFAPSLEQMAVMDELLNQQATAK